MNFLKFGQIIYILCVYCLAYHVAEEGRSFCWSKKAFWTFGIQRFEGSKNDKQIRLQKERAKFINSGSATNKGSARWVSNENLGASRVE